jgi:hypothetical protein
MWILILINTVVGSAVSIPGYSSQATCTAAAAQEISEFGSASGNTWASTCVHPN